MIETFDEFTNSYHIIVLFDKSERENLDYLVEGIWTSSGEKDYWQRLDKPKFDFEQLHVHIARQKHINTKSKQVTWNVDGTRHDKKTFNQNFNGLEKAKEIARNALGLNSDAILEFIEHQGVGQLLLETVEYLPAETSVFVFKLISKTKKQILHS
ncbi:DUF6367 family protein [Hymenobacter rubripertinctus]|uniref:DUF6367 family protein n=1 Tax=Hymenobacter rubripertinctus TaxID=2029981 RepID=UPI0011C4015A|nr:DUF6367 family protein [Hymenobacter rubripertinctus]